MLLSLRPECPGPIRWVDLDSDLDSGSDSAREPSSGRIQESGSQLARFPDWPFAGPAV